MTRSALLLALALAIPGVAAAQAGPDCGSFDEFGADPGVLGLATVTAAGPEGRLHFSADRTTGQPCLAVRCQARAFVVKGDEVVTGGRRGPFVCAWYKRKGLQLSHGTYGWLPISALTAIAYPPAPAPIAWAGKWVRDRELGLETSLTVRPARGGRLKVTGQSLFAHSREDVAQGSVNTGEVDAVIEVRGRVAGMLLPGPGGRRPSLDAGDHDGECAVGMVLLDDWLVVVDDLACGGLNVTFSGVYRHDR